jgi:nitrilase
MAAKQVMNGRDKVRVAVVQAVPVFLEKEKCIAKATRLIETAGQNGAELISFSEVWLSGYPYWGEGWESNLNKWIQTRIMFQDNALVIPSEDTDILCEAAAKAHANVVIGCNEMDPRPQSRTIYNTLLFIDRDGSIMGRHRKLMPTYVERAFWGNGTSDDLVVFETDVGRVGGLICGEHLMTLVRAAMIQKGEEFHVAVFPGTFKLHTGPMLEEPDTEGNFWGHSAVRQHALEAGAFVLNACGYITDKEIPKDFPLRDNMNFGYAIGGSSIIAPLGIPLQGEVYNEEKILYADCEANMIKVWKTIIDTVGHYSRPDVVQLKILPAPAVESSELVRRSKKASKEELDRIAQKHNVDPAIVRSVIEEVSA